MFILYWILFTAVVMGSFLFVLKINSLLIEEAELASNGKSRLFNRAWQANLALFAFIVWQVYWWTILFNFAKVVL